MSGVHGVDVAEGRIILCPGQGAQFVGMARAWVDKSADSKGVFERAESLLGDRLGAPLRSLCFDGPAETLNQTDISQPAIFVASVACWRGLLGAWGFGNGEAGVLASAGLSLGEYTALHIAGAFSFEDGLELVTLRGRAMQDAAEASAGGMLALIGPDDEQAQSICDEARGGEVLVCANFNAPGQVVLSGHKSACERADKVAQAKGFRATMLPVAGAFHSPLMQPAADRLSSALKNTNISLPKHPVWSNVTGNAYPTEQSASSADRIRESLVSQLTSPVRWVACCQGILSAFGASAPGGVHELAPGKALSGLMRRIDRNTKVVNHDEPQT